MVTLIYCLCGIIPLLYELMRRRQLPYDGLLVLNISWIITFSVTPIVLLNVKEAEDFSENLLRYQFGSVWPPVVILMGYTALVAGWVLGDSRWAGAGTPLRVDEKWVVLLCQLGLMVFLLAFGIYVSGYGGLRQALLLGDSIRYGTGELRGTDIAVRFLPAGSLVLYYSFFRAFVRPDARSRVFYLIGLGIALAGMIVLLPIYSGRGYVIALGLTMFLIFASDRRRAHLGLGIVGVGVASVVVLFGKQLFYGLPLLIAGRGREFSDAFGDLNAHRLGDRNPLMALVKEYQHAPVSLELAMEVAGSELPFTWFRDFPLALMSLLPRRLLDLFMEVPDSISHINTRLQQGLEIASLPPGLPGHFFMCAGWLGVIGGMFAYGLVGGAVHKRLLKNCGAAPGTIVFFVLFSLLYGQFISNGDPKVYVHSDLFVIVLALGAIVIASRFQSRRARRIFARSGDPRAGEIGAVVPIGKQSDG